MYKTVCMNIITERYIDNIDCYDIDIDLREEKEK